MTRNDTFRQVPWSLWHCGIAIMVFVIFLGTCHILKHFINSVPSYLIYISLSALMLVWMAFLPLWIAKQKQVLHRPKIKKVAREFALAIPVLVCLIIVQYFCQYAIKYLTGSDVTLGSELSPLRNGPNAPYLYPYLIMAFTLGPLSEELFFRGLLYNALRQRTHVVIAVILQAIIFSLVHYGLTYKTSTSLVFVFIFGVVMAMIYEWRKTLWTPIALHTLYNGLFSLAVITLMLLNSHTPAKAWEEAQQPPQWRQENAMQIEKQDTGETQRLYAINEWGSKGKRLWKKELCAFEAVCEWFPEDRPACAKSRLGIAVVYLTYLRDPRRCVVECDRVLSTYSDQTSTCADVLVQRGWAYYNLHDYAKSRESFQKILDSYPDYDQARKAAREGIRILDSRE